jgi:hypothetical protein
METDHRRLLTVTRAGAAVTFAIDLARYTFALWHWACVSSDQTFLTLEMAIVFSGGAGCRFWLVMRAPSGL